MFRYVSDISELSHDIISRYLDKKNVAIDATLGNGYDCDFLSSNFKKVYAFDIQKEACENYSIKNDNVVVINDSHHKFEDYIKEQVDCIIYNLGYLPGGEKTITTKSNTSLISIQKGLELLASGGMMTIAIYRGHDEGKIEENCIIGYLKTLNKKHYGVMIHEYLNRASTAPLLVVIEKK